MKKRLSFLKARKLKKIGYFKLPDTGHRWAGTKFKWARIRPNGELMVYSVEHLNSIPVEILQERNLRFDLSEEWKTRGEEVDN